MKRRDRSKRQLATGGEKTRHIVSSGFEKPCRSGVAVKFVKATGKLLGLRRILHHWTKSPGLILVYNELDYGIWQSS
jgi:hypothetical protein